MEEAEREVHAIEMICLSEASLAKFFFGTLNQRSALYILQSLLQSQPPKTFIPTHRMKTIDQYHWFVFCLLKWFAPTEAGDLNWDALVEAEFSTLSAKLTRKFSAAMIDVQRRQTEESALVLANVLTRIDESFSSIGNYWKTRCESYFKRMPFKKLFDQFGFNAFHLFSTMEMTQIESIIYSYTNSRDFETLFQAPAMWTLENGFLLIQNQIVMDRFYPNYVMYETDVRERSLIETSLVKNMHFVDIVSHFVRDSFIRDGKALAYGYSKALSKMSPWIFLAAAGDIQQRFPEINEEVPEFLSECPEILQNALQRILNDNQLFMDLRHYTGQILSAKDFASKSYPMVISGLFRHSPTQFLEFQSKPLICISDQDRRIDSDFIMAAMAIRLLIRVMEGVEDADTVLLGDNSELPWCLDQIENHDTRESVLMDLFSLLFLKKDGRFLCDKLIAETLLATILERTDTPILMKYADLGRRNVQVTRALSDTESIDDVLIPKKQLLLEALEKRDWQIAEHIASLRKSYSRLVAIYRSVAQYRDDAVDAIPEHACVEIALSFDPKQEVIARAEKRQNLLPEVQQLLSKRRESRYPMKTVRTLKRCYENQINSRLARLSATSWEIPSFGKSQTRLKCLPAFMKYLDGIVSGLLRAKLADTIYDALQMQPMETLNAMLRSGKVEEAAILAESLGVNVLDLILQGNSYPDNVITFFTQQVPLVGIAAVVAADNHTSETFETPNRVCAKLMAIKAAVDDKEMELRNDFGRSVVLHLPFKEVRDVSLETAYHVNQDYVGEDEAWKLIASAFDRGDIDVVGELSFLVDAVQFSSYVRERLSESSFEFIKRLCDVSSITVELSDEIDFLSSIRDDVSHLFPLPDAFKSLLDQREYRKASEFLKLFEKKVELDECLQGFDEKEKLFSFYPNWNSKITDELCPQTDTDSFFNNIPQEWRTNDSPEQILSNHIENELGLVVQILSKFKEMNCDRSFIESTTRLYKSTQNLDDVISRATIFVSVCRSLEFVREKLRIIFEEALNKFEVTNPDSESNVLRVLIQINGVTKHYSDIQFSKQLDVLISIVSSLPMAKYNRQYKLANVGASLFSICLDLDLTKEFISMSQLWSFTQHEIEELQEHYLLNCYEISCYDTPFEAPKCKHIYRKIMNLLSYSHFYDPLMISECVSSFPPKEETAFLRDPHVICARIRNLSRSSTRPLPSHAQMEPLYNEFFEHAPTDIIAMYYAQQGNYEKAIERINSIADEEKRARVFRDAVVEIAISKNEFENLRVHMSGHDDLFKAVIPVAGPNLRYEMELELEMFKEAGYTALELYGNSRSKSKAHVYLEMAQSAMERVTPRTDDDVNFLTTINMQRLFDHVMPVEMREDFDLNLFGSDANKVVMVQLLCMCDELDLAITIIQAYDLNPGEIGYRIVDTMVNQGEDVMVSFVQSFETRCRWSGIPDTFQRLVYAMVMRIIHTIKLDQLGLTIVRAIANPKLKSLLLLQFHEYEEAAAIAFDNKITENIPLILHLWGNPPRSAVYLKCLKAIE